LHKKSWMNVSTLSSMFLLLLDGESESSLRETSGPYSSLDRWLEFLLTILERLSTFINESGDLLGPLKAHSFSEVLTIDCFTPSVG